MRILVDIGHPAHVHFFKNFIREMEKRGHELVVTARDKDVALRLLKAYNIEYTAVGRAGKGSFSLVREWIGRDRKIYKLSRTFRPDILTGIHSPCVAHVARLTGAKSIVFTDNDLTMLTNMGTFPFADVICTPSCFKKDFGKKHVRYNGYKELAYLHPNYFRPDQSVLDDSGLTENDRFVILRFVSWKSAHDMGQHGFDTQAKYELVNRLKEYARVFITSEAPLPADLEKYRLSVSPERLHDLLYYAAMLVGDCGTTAAESGVLGTPAIRYNSFVGPKDLGFLAALGEKNGLIHSFSELDRATAKAMEILRSDNIKKEWAEKRTELIRNSIDVTAFMIWFIENYPESLKIMKKNPDYQNEFTQDKVAVVES